MIYRNGTEIQSGSWTSNITLNFDGLSKGTYNFTILVNDTSGNFAVDSIFIFIIDTTDPSINTPADIQYNEGSSSNTIDWTATDTHAANYEVFQNGSSYTTGPWVSGVPISIDINFLNEGVYNFTIVVFDTNGNSRQDEVIVVVVDATTPGTSTPSDINYEHGSGGNNLTWTGADLHALNYVVYKNGSEHASGPWVTTIAFNVSIDGFIPGIYNLTIIFFDTSGNFGRIVSVTV